jgi:ABC-type branched-subunit amino acid transport system substrate-binding protein
VRLLGAVVVLALLGAACSNADDDTASKSNVKSDTTLGGKATGVPGVTDKEIRFAAFGTNSNNPLGTCILDCFMQGVKAYFAMRNEDGGVYGHKLVVSDVIDDELANNQQAALQIVSDNKAFGAFSAAELAAGYADVAKAGIPLYTWAINLNEMNGHDSIYGNNAVVCGQCTQRFYAYAGTLVHAKRVATLGYGISQNSKDCANAQAKSIDKYGKDTGEKVVYTNDNLAFGLPNGIGPEVSAMKKAGVDFVAGCLDLNAMKTLAQEMERQGMGDVPMVHANTYDQAFVAKAGHLFDGDLVQVGFRPFEADAGHSDLGKYHKWMKKTGAEETELAMEGWINADLAYQGIKAAGPSFDRAKVIAATNKLTAFSAGGLINPIDWSRQHERWTDADPKGHGYAKECMAWVKVVDGKFKVAGDKEKPFYCWDGSTTDWSEPTPTDVK